MRKNKKSMFILFLLIICVAFNVSSCKREEMNEENVNTSVPIKSSNELVERAESIADNIIELVGIEDVTAIIYNEKAIVAVEMTDGNELTLEMRQMIKNIVLENDKKITDVLITDDRKIFDKIDNIAQNMIKGQDMKDYFKEIDKIVRKISKENKND